MQSVVHLVLRSSVTKWRCFGIVKNIFKAFRFKIQNFEENVSVPKFWTEKKSSAKVVIYFRDFITHPKFSWNFLHPKKIRNVSDKTSTSSGKWRKSNLVKINYFVATRISIGPLTNKEDIFNQFMEKRDRIFEVKTLTFNTEVTMDIGFQRIITCSKTEFEQKFRNSAFRNYSSKHILWITLSVVRDESLRNMYINKLKVELCLSIASMLRKVVIEGMACQLPSS